jgi:hypothetical protein
MSKARDASKIIVVAQRLSGALAEFDAAVTAEKLVLAEKPAAALAKLRKGIREAAALLLDIGAQEFQRTMAEAKDRIGGGKVNGKE